MRLIEVDNVSYKKTLYFNGQRKQFLSNVSCYFKIARYKSGEDYYVGPIIDTSCAIYETLSKYAKTKLGIILNTNKICRSDIGDTGAISLLKKEGAEEYYFAILTNETRPIKGPDGLWQPVWAGVDYITELVLYTQDEFNSMLSVNDFLKGIKEDNVLKNFVDIAKSRCSDFTNKWLVLNNMVPLGFNKTSWSPFNFDEDDNIAAEFTGAKSFNSRKLLNWNSTNNVIKDIIKMMKGKIDKQTVIDNIPNHIKNAESDTCCDYETQICGYGINSIDVMDFATAEPVNFQTAWNDFYKARISRFDDFMQNDTSFVWCDTCRCYHNKNNVPLFKDKYCPLVVQNSTYICSECKRPFIYTGTCHNNNMTNCCRECTNPHSIDNETYRIRSYHNNPDIKYYDYDENKKENYEISNTGSFGGYGIELEVGGKGENNSESEKVIKLLKKEVYCMHDGSINPNSSSSTGGFEIITYPHTEKALYNMKWKNTMNYLLKRGYKSHDIKTCGLHMHFSRTLFKDSDSIVKMMYFYDKFYKDVCNFARRSKAKATRWAKYYVSNPDFLTSQDLFDELVCHYNDYNRCQSHSYRYKAVNITNYDTVEVRIMRGTLNYDTFMATLDFLITIQKNANKIAMEDLDNIDKWLEGMKPETIQYINEHRCFAKTHKRIPAITEVPGRVKDDVDWGYVDSDGREFTYKIQIINGKPMRFVTNTQTHEIRIEEIGEII